MTNGEDSLWIALQICDSGFPGGAFAHSLGLESALHHRLVNESSGTLDFFVSQTLEQACTQLLPLVCAAQRSYYTEVNPSTEGSRDCYINIKNEHPNFGFTQDPKNDYHSDDTSMLNRLMRVDDVCHIVLTNEVARRSSIAQGKCFLRAAREAFSSTSEKMNQLSDALDFKHENDRSNRNKVDVKIVSAPLHIHYAPIFGCVCGILQVNEELSCRMFLRCILRDIFSSAARLNILGPLEGARKQKEFITVIEKLLITYYKKDTYKEVINSHTNSDAKSTNNSSNKRKYDNSDSDNCYNNDLKNQDTENIDVKTNDEKIKVEAGELSYDMDDCSDRDLEPYVTSPILEIVQARHDVLYARLFNS